MNVLYRCPKCGRKLFTLPGGTKIKCFVHTQQVYLQVQDYNGPDFLGNEDGNEQSKTGHIVTTGADPRNVPKRKMDFEPIENTENLDVLRTIYLNESGEKADGRWQIDRLRYEIQNVREFKADKAAREYQEKRAKIAAETAAKLAAAKDKQEEEEREKLADLDAYIKKQINAALANKEELQNG